MANRIFVFQGNAQQYISYEKNTNNTCNNDNPGNKDNTKKQDLKEQYNQSI